MVAEAVAWVCRSPRRLAVTVGGAILLLVIGSAVLTGEDGARRQGATPAPSASAPVAVVPDASPMVDTAVQFVNTWGRRKDGESARQWHARVAPLSTPELAAALALTDVENLPAAAPQGTPVVRFVAQDSGMVAVPLSDGSTVVVTVVSAGRSGWQVSDIQPDVGDAGDVAGDTASQGAGAATKDGEPGAVP